HSTLYLNSFFDVCFTVKPLLARLLRLAPKRRCVIAPRGEFSPGALDLKTTKKKTFLVISKFAKLYSNLIWQASSEHEFRDITNVIGSSAKDIRIAADLPAKPKSSLSKTARVRNGG